jgi:putative ABC transport system substrate-binding protein
LAQAALPPMVGFVSAGDEASAADFLLPLREGLASLGRVEGRTLRIEALYAHYTVDRIPALVAELERRGVSLIVTHGAAAGRVIGAARTVPAVYVVSSDPVSAGRAKDLAQPLFNATGVTLLVAELNGKRLDLLLEIAPAIRRIAVLANRSHPGEELERAFAEARARQLDIEMAFLPFGNRTELDRAFEALDANLPEAVLALADGFVIENRERLVDFTMSRVIPLFSHWAVMAEAGALFTYGPRRVETFRRVAYYVDRILKGAKAAELPIEQPTVMELAVNLKTARRLGLAVPPSVLAAADIVIE